MSDNDIRDQENVSARSHSRQKKQQVRHRASVACSACRDRRIRCVVPKGETACTQCKRAGTACVIKNDDERRRPISKAYMSSLSERIRLLEGMLLSQGVVPPPAVHPPKTRQESREERERPERMASPPDETSPESDPGPPEMLSLPSGQSGSGTQDLVQQLLSAPGNLSLDQLSGQPVYVASPDAGESREPPQVRRSERILQSLTPATHDYLMDCFWTHYNATIYLIDRAAFEADREAQTPRFYTPFLHITMLAMGFRFADCSHADMGKISLGDGGRESCLQREAKHMLDTELERSGGIPSVQALLLLGDLECGVGRDNTGWMYASMANRLALDLGLHLDARSAGLPGLTDCETAVRHMVMKAALVLDKYWALYQGRSTSIKSEELGVDLLAGRLSGVLSPGQSQKGSLGQEIYEHLFALMELAGQMVETRDRRLPGAALGEPENRYRHTISLDRQLQNWYRRLPDHLAWKPANIKTAPMSFFLLHQQYHVAMILLHRPWARYGSLVSASGSPSPPSPGSTPGDAAVDDSRTTLSRSICTQQAVRVARIFWQHRQRFDGRRIYLIGMQHAGTAAMALITALAGLRSSASSTDRRSYLACLDILAAALADMSHTYQPAARMHDLLRLVLQQLRVDHVVAGTTSTIYGVLPVRRDGPDSLEPASKKQCRPSSPGRRDSAFARPPPPRSVGSACPATAASQPLTMDHNFGLGLFSAPLDLEELGHGPSSFYPPPVVLSPVSLGGLDKAGEMGDRNHDLDFFQF